MTIVSRRTIGQIVLAYDDGTSPPVEVLPLGSLVSVADGTLWISQGSGVYDSVGSPQNYPDTTALPSPVPNAGTVASIGPGSPVARRTFYVSDGTQWVRAPDDAGLRYSASNLANLPGTAEGALDGDVADLAGGTVTGKAVRTGGVWLWTKAQANDFASLPSVNVSPSAIGIVGETLYVRLGSEWVLPPQFVGVYANIIFYVYDVPFIVNSFGLTNQPVIP